MNPEMHLAVMLAEGFAFTPRGSARRHSCSSRRFWAAARR